ncbi:MAG: DUF1080 domain-containing protein [Actinomycetota bacterium]|nr:DUF1080 domain-containing protein [Actinomycetota bacterium]
MALTSEFTSFTLDNMGRFLCNTLEEALHSAGIDAGLGSPPTDARPFDVIMVGGGTFASVFAQHLLFIDRTSSRRILVVDRGPFVLPEHVQNLPMLGVGLPDWVVPWQAEAFSGGRGGLRVCLGGRSLEWGGWSPEMLDDELAVKWPAAVVADLQGPVQLDGQPQAGYFQQAGEQLGVVDTNDFVYGELHAALRQQVRDGLTSSPAGSVAGDLPLAQLPDHPKVRFASSAPDIGELRAMLGQGGQLAGKTKDELKELLKLEAPLAVQTRAEPGKFALNKFSALPLLVKASRFAADESYPYDQLKRLMVVPGWHVQELATQTLPDNQVKVTGLWVVRGLGGEVARREFIPLADDGIVVIGLGTVESTRLARQTFKESLSWRAAQRMGNNLQAHLRSNLHIRIPRTSLPGLPQQGKALEVSALFVKGRASLDGRDRYFHLQITASGLPAAGAEAETELFKKVPDIDHLGALRRSDDTHVVVTLRGIGEMAPDNPDSTISLPTTPGWPTDFGRSKARVAIGDAKSFAEGTLANASPQTKGDAELWQKMDRLADEVAVMLAGGKEFEILTSGGGAVKVNAGATPDDLAQLHPHLARRDGVGTTHHEAGTLWMGEVAESVTDGFGGIHDTTNCYCAGPMLFPSLGSPNPMLTGVALARRTGDYLQRRLATAPGSSVLTIPVPFKGDGPDWQVLFDGTVQSFKRWHRVGPDAGAAGEPPCGFRYVDGQILTVGAGDFALLFHPEHNYSDFILKLQFRVFDPAANSGVFLRIRNPRRPLPEPIASRAAEDLRAFSNNLAWTAVHSGFEVQIDDTAGRDPRVDFYGVRPEPSGLNKNRTGAIYKIPAGDPIPGSGALDQQLQQYQPGPPLQPRPWKDPAAWYEYEIRVEGDSYQVWLGQAGGSKTRTSLFTNADPARGIPAFEADESGFIGLQAYSQKRVAFRHIQVKLLP